MKVSEIKYVRPNHEDIIEKINETKTKFLSCKSASEFLEIHKEFDGYIQHVSTMISLAQIRFTLNMNDEFYAKEQDYYDEVLPAIQVAQADLYKCYVETPFVDELKKYFPEIMFKNIEIQIKASSPLILEESIEENKIVTEYSKLMSSLVVDFDGEKVPFSAMARYFANEDRKIRESAVIAYAKTLSEHAEELDDIYDRLVLVRTKMGKKLGYDSFSPLGYLRMQRNCYDKNDIAMFRENVKKYIVPLSVKIRQKVQKEMGWEVQNYWDKSVFTKKEPRPYGTVEDIFEQGKKMYHEMDEATGSLFNRMLEADSFDVIAREGKFGGGYCTALPDYKLPFILANFNGSSGDIEVLTHEFGHAYAFSRSLEIDCLTEFSMETAEVHSMSMEFLAYPWNENFFKDRTADFEFNHIGGAICFIPYGTIVDYFQQTIYDNPDMTPKQRNDFFRKIEKEFMPYMTCDNIPGFNQGRVWQRQQHIYESPFYYIDYCIAQFMALQFLALSRKNWKDAFEKYKKFVHINRTKSFVETIAECEMLSPFEEKSFQQVVASVEELLEI